MKKIRTVVIAAAGRGTRLGEMTAEIPKHLIPVGGKPFLHYLLQEVRDFGFTRIIVVIGYHAEKMRAFLEAEEGEYEIVEQSMDGKYGTAAVVELLADVVGDEPFVFLNGDALLTHDAFEAVSHDDGFVHVVGMAHDEPQHYGVLSVRNGLLQEVVEKPEVPAGDLINIGVYGFPPEIFDHVRELEPSARGEYELTDALNVLAAAGKVKAHPLIGEWVDLGKPEDIPEVESFLKRYHFV